MSASPTLIDMHAADLLAETEITLQDIAAQVGLWGDWRKLLHVMHNKLGDLSTLPTVNWDIRQLEAYLARIRAVTDRSPHKPFIGICTNCGRNIYADPQETLQQCACKHIRSGKQPASSGNVCTSPPRQPVQPDSVQNKPEKQSPPVQSNIGEIGTLFK
jgi:hypothetical protein